MSDAARSVPRMTVEDLPAIPEEPRRHEIVDFFRLKSLESAKKILDAFVPNMEELQAA